VNLAEDLALRTSSPSKIDQAVKAQAASITPDASDDELGEAGAAWTNAWAESMRIYLRAQ
jgi:hypothetical protein